jgi:hypothetical protein
MRNPNLKRVVAIGAAVLGLVGSSGPGWGADIQADPSTYRGLLPTLEPGDRLILAAGDYPDGLPVTDLEGTASAPIVITGPQSGDPAVFLADASRNTVSIRRSAHVTLRYLTLDGQQIAYVDAVKVEGGADNWAHHVTLEHLIIVNHDPNQQTVGISTKAPVWDLVIRQNVLHSAGTGMYLGNSDGSAPFVRGLIEHNLVVDPEGYCMQIKHQNPRPSLSGMPPDGSVTIIRHNVFIKDDDPSGSGDRPNVLIGHLPLSGAGQHDRYEIYGNLFFHNPREALFQGEGNLHLHDNLFADSGAGWPAVNIRPHNDVPREVLVYHNTVYDADTGIALSGTDPGSVQAVVGNAVFATTPLAIGSTPATENVTDSVANAGTYVLSPTVDLATLDLYPSPSGALQGAALDPADPIAGLSADLSADLDHDVDFNGVARDFTWRGAYHGGEAANPGWHVAEDIKPETGASPGPDAGTPPADAAPGVDAASGADAAGPGADGAPSTPGDSGGGCNCASAARGSTAPAGSGAGPGLVWRGHAAPWLMLFLWLALWLRARTRTRTRTRTG